MGDVGRSVQAGASIADAAIGAGATISAAHTQADANRYAADKQSQAAENSLAFNRDVFNTDQQNAAPYIQAGQSAINNLSAETAPGGSLNQDWTTPFSFSGVNLENDPAYQFNLQQGQQAIQRSAAAQGGLVSGGALKDLNDYSQGFAANQYQQSYANALGQYQQAYQIFQNNQANSFNRQAAIAGIGQTGTNTLAGAGANAAGINAQTATQGAAAAGNFLTQGAAASSAGMVGLGNSLQGGINGVANALASQNRSSYGGSDGYAPPSSQQWASYDAGSTPAGSLDAYGNLS